jgi:putative transposase
MAFAYSIRDQGGVYFVTFTVHQWADVFTRKTYIDLLLDSVEYCQGNKGLEVYSWVVMTNHCHFILRARNENLSDVIRDFKKYTSKSIFAAIKANPSESRKEWLPMMLSHNGKIWFWEEGYHGEEVLSLEFYRSKVDYIHANPVRAGLVAKEEDYLFSSAGDYLNVRRGRLELSYYG